MKSATSDMTEVKAPDCYKNVPWSRILFMAGSIEMGAAVDWQKTTAAHLSDIHGLLILNPRREAWDPSWEQSASNPVFNEQVTWELDGINCATTISFYFDGKTKSPISLLELGLVARTGKPVIIYCPKDFYRRGNVEVVANKYNLQLFDNESDWLESLRKHCTI